MVSMLRTKSFVFGEARDYGIGLETIGLVDWWSEIEQSEKWQPGIYYTLSASYALGSVVALLQLIRIQLRVPEYGWTTQKVFHLMNFVVTGSILFGFYRNVFTIRLKVWHTGARNDAFGASWPSVFLDMYITGFVFGPRYIIRSLPTDNLRLAYYVINGLVYLVQVSIWINVRLSQSSASVEVARLFFSVLSLFAAMGFMIYGGRLYVMLRCFPTESQSRQKKLQEVGYGTGICCTCFLIRCFMDALSASGKDVDVDVLDHPILNLFYYMVVENLLSAMVLFILRKLPPRRASDQYQSIQ